MKFWAARDDYGLYLFEEKPYLTKNRMGVNIFWADNKNSYKIDSDLFKEITFENSPQQIEIKLMNEIVGVVESPLKTFPRVNEFEVGASYRH